MICLGLEKNIFKVGIFDNARFVKMSRYVCHDSWHVLFVININRNDPYIGQRKRKTPRLCYSVGYVQTMPAVFTPGINYPTKNLFCKFCRTFISVPGTSGSSVRQCHKYPGYGYITFITFVSSVRPCHNTRNFCEQHFRTVPGTSESSVRSPYPYRELLRLC